MERYKIRELNKIELNSAFNVKNSAQEETQTDVNLKTTKAPKPAQANDEKNTLQEVKESETRSERLEVEQETHEVK